MLFFRVNKNFLTRSEMIHVCSAQNFSYSSSTYDYLFEELEYMMLRQRSQYVDSADLSNTEEPSRQLVNHTSDIEEEFICGVCHELLVLPTTLNCGHSFCRHCLALWFDSSKKAECPSCRKVL